MIPQCWVLLVRLDKAKIDKSRSATVKDEPIDSDPEDSRSPRAVGFENNKSELIYSDEGVNHLLNRNDNAREIVKVDCKFEGENTTTSTKLRSNPLKQEVLLSRQDLNYVTVDWWEEITVNKVTVAISTKKNARRCPRVKKSDFVVQHRCRMCLKTYKSEPSCLLKHSQTHFCWVKLERCTNFAQERVEDHVNRNDVDDEVKVRSFHDLSDISPEKIEKYEVGNPEEIILPSNSSSSLHLKLEVDIICPKQEEFSTSIKPKICEICQQIFPNELDLSVHQRSHERHSEMTSDRKYAVKHESRSDIYPERIKQIKIEKNEIENREEYFVPCHNSSSHHLKSEADIKYPKQEEPGIEIRHKICEICHQIFPNELDLSVHQKSHEEHINISPVIETSNTKYTVEFESLPKLSCYFCNQVFHIKTELEVHILGHLQPLQFSNDSSETEPIEAHCEEYECLELEDDSTLDGVEDKTNHPQEALIKEMPPFILFKDCPSLLENEILSSPAFTSESSQVSNQNSYHQSTDFCIEDQKNLGLTTQGNHNLHTNDQTLNLKVLNKKQVAENAIKNHSERTIYCNECGESFNKKQSLIHHLAVHESSKRSRCKLCQITYLAYRKHRRTLSHIKEEKCTVCIEKYHAYAQFQARRKVNSGKSLACRDCSKQMSKTKPKPYKLLCHICGARHKMISSLDKHMKAKHPDVDFKLKTDPKQLKCPSCTVVFKSFSVLHRHKCAPSVVSKPTDGIHSFVCKTCGKLLGNAHAYMLHIRLHESKVKCKHCGMKFYTNKHQAYHNRQFHNPKHDFKCNPCSMTFETAKMLKNHDNAIHSSFDLPRCDICLMWFSSKVLLLEHEVCHRNEYRYRCPYCLERMSEEVKYLAHLSEVHGIQFSHKCRFCELNFKRLSELKRHVRSHKSARIIKSLEVVVIPRLCEKEGTIDYNLEWKYLVADDLSFL